MQNNPKIKQYQHRDIMLKCLYDNNAFSKILHIVFLKKIFYRWASPPPGRIDFKNRLVRLRYPRPLRPLS